MLSNAIHIKRQETADLEKSFITYSVKALLKSVNVRESKMDSQKSSYRMKENKSHSKHEVIPAGRKQQSGNRTAHKCELCPQVCEELSLPRSSLRKAPKRRFPPLSNAVSLCPSNEAEQMDPWGLYRRLAPASRLGWLRLQPRSCRGV